MDEYLNLIFFVEEWNNIFNSSKLRTFVIPPVNTIDFKNLTLILYIKDELH